MPKKISAKLVAQLVAGSFIATVLSVVLVSNVASAPPAKPAPIMFTSCSPAPGPSNCSQTQAGISGGFSIAIGVAPVPGVISSLSAVSNPPGAGFKNVVTVFKNFGVPAVGALSCTITGTQNSCSNNIDTLTVAAGDIILYEVVSNGGAASAILGGVAFRAN